MFFVPSSRRFYSSVRRGAVAAVALAAWVLLPATSLAAVPPAFSNTPSVLPGNVASFAFEAQSAAEFGDLVALAGSVRDSGSLPVTVVMSIWACEQGGNATCVTTPGATWTHPITLNIYAVDTSGATPVPGAKLLSVTNSFTLPYRPSPDPVHCPGSTRWYDAGSDGCYNGLAHPIKFALPAGTTLPDQIIWTIAFNTSHHGYQPIGPVPGNAPYDSLNVGAQTFDGQPAYGTDVDPDVAFVAGDAGNLHAESGWTPNTPLACIGSACAVRGPGDPEPTPTPTPTASPSETVAGATSNPSANAGVTPPPTSTERDPSNGSAASLPLILAMAFALVGFGAGAARRRSLRNR